MFLQNENIQLRALEPEDLEVLYKWENDTQLWIHGNTLAPYSKMMLRRYIEDAQQYDIFQSNQLRMMICLTKDESILGTVDIYDVHVHSQRAGVGILIDPKYRKQGYAQQVLALLEEYCFQFLNLHQLYAHISIKNEISIDLFEKAGYQKSGVMKDWIRTPKGYEDVILVQLINKTNPSNF